MDVTASFFAGSMLSILMPLGLLVLVGLYWAWLVRRRSAGARTGKTSD
jgi:hypothetical protein